MGDHHFDVVTGGHSCHVLGHDRQGVRPCQRADEVGAGAADGCGDVLTTLCRQVDPDELAAAIW